MKQHVMLLAACAVLAMAGCQKKATPTEGGADGSGAGKTEAPKDGEATLAFNPTAPAGASFDVNWTGPGNASDYIDLTPRGYTQTSGEISYSYVRDSGPTGVRLRAPTTPGDYDVRYVADLGTERLVKAVSPLTVSAATASVTAPATAQGGGELRVDWTGPNGQGDYIDIVRTEATETSGELSYAYTRDGTPAVLRVPGETGAYDVRYVLEGPGKRQVLSRMTVQVTTPEATVLAPSATPKGEPFKASWTGPGFRGDYVDLVPKGAATTSGELSYFYVRDGAEGQLNAPAEPGEYDVRYVLDAATGRLILARVTVVVQ